MLLQLASGLHLPLSSEHLSISAFIRQTTGRMVTLSNAPTLSCLWQSATDAATDLKYCFV